MKPESKLLLAVGLISVSSGTDFKSFCKRAAQIFAGRSVLILSASWLGQKRGTQEEREKGYHKEKEFCHLQVSSQLMTVCLATIQKLWQCWQKWFKTRLHIFLTTTASLLRSQFGCLATSTNLWQMHVIAISNLPRELLTSKFNEGSCIQLTIVQST